MAINRLKEIASQNLARVNVFHRHDQHRRPTAGSSGRLTNPTGDLKSSYQNHSATLDEIKIPAGLSSAPSPFSRPLPQASENNTDSNILELAPAENHYLADEDILEF
ncbi:MAG TPA: hypothetical protein VM870_00245 [Pyrinomonadaceae bacterium]|jgi:hypothetical protein|nr:hypothetical protein [Pyrinomonadaceae bacterium]